MNRPEYIARILDKNASTIEDKNVMVLESYITDLEINQPGRPARIASILETDTSSYDAEAFSTIEAYVADLESKQDTGLSGKHQMDKPDTMRSPLWAIRRRVQLERLRRKRFDRKHHTDHRDN